MNLPIYFNPKKTHQLYGLSENFNFLKELFIKKKIPKVLMLSGKKGLGKFTLINHLMHFIFESKNYDVKSYILNSNSAFHIQLLNNTFTNIIYLSGTDYQNSKIENIRDLKKRIYQTSISDKPRFIIFDDVELFNNNSLNALLKLLEEPTKNNFFFLIHNNSKPLLETVKSRCLDIKVILNEKKKINIIESLIKRHNINPILDPKSSQLTPGNFIKFNYIFDEYNISPNEDFSKNLEILLNLFKKDKNIMFIDMVSFLTDNYFNTLKNRNLFTNEKIIEYKTFVYENINKYFIYNLNQNALLNNINNKING
jgi:DNA polymerase III subunit delta'